LRDCRTVFLNNVGTVYNKKNEIILRTSLKNQLYWIDEEYISMLTNHVETLLRSDDIEDTDEVEINCNVNLQELHKKFGHLSEYNVKRLVREKLVLGTGVSYEQIKDERLDKCIACYKGKIKANSTEKHNPVKDRDIFEKVGVD